MTAVETAPGLGATRNGATSEASATAVSESELHLQRALASMGGLHAATGAVALLAPGVLYRTIDGFGVENHHFIRHVGTIDVALGGVLLVSARKRRWRLPILTAATTQSVLHLALHLLEGERPRPPWIAYLDYSLIGAVTAALAWCLVRARQLERADQPAS